MVLWLRYLKDGPKALHKKEYAQSSGYDREVVVRDIEDNCLTLPEAAVKAPSSQPRQMSCKPFSSPAKSRAFL